MINFKKKLDYSIQPKKLSLNKNLINKNPKLFNRENLKIKKKIESDKKIKTKNIS